MVNSKLRGVAENDLLLVLVVEKLHKCKSMKSFHGKICYIKSTYEAMFLSELSLHVGDGIVIFSRPKWLGHKVRFDY